MSEERDQEKDLEHWIEVTQRQDREIKRLTQDRVELSTDLNTLTSNLRAEQKTNRLLRIRAEAAERAYTSTKDRLVVLMRQLRDLANVRRADEARKMVARILSAYDDSEHKRQTTAALVESLLVNVIEANKVDLEDVRSDISIMVLANFDGLSEDAQERVSKILRRAGSLKKKG